ncbi:peroxiredoxin [Aquimarina gracilis]|uniref:thioredoxin-dependent peroxiredoxin n=1 Tax=Aquimarina gracilis TaxID=874422 RepID=A0ABU5ZYE0_9FLAO|nr:peroxiredoxin [Aquimarina gracilis]MEB3346878.1 peroxiredoxin [Aquimarina gracilis]
MGLKVGDKVPQFTVKDDQGNDFDSNSIIGVKPVVIYFYPKNFTPGCTKEACDFRDSYADFKDLGAEVIGISSDSIKSHTRFKNKYRLPFLFLSDHKNTLRKLFGVKAELLGLLPGRETFVIDKDGVVQLKFNSLNASKHLGKAIAKVKELAAV